MRKDVREFCLQQDLSTPSCSSFSLRCISNDIAELRWTDVVESRTIKEVMYERVTDYYFTVATFFWYSVFNFPATSVAEAESMDDDCCFPGHSTWNGNGFLVCYCPVRGWR